MGNQQGCGQNVRSKPTNGRRTGCFNAEKMRKAVAKTNLWKYDFKDGG
jgi:hypothetical protein